MRPRQVKVFALVSLAIIDAATVKLDRVSISVVKRERHAAPEVLVSAVAQDANALEFLADLRTGFDLFCWKSQTERSIDEADLESLDCFTVGDPTTFEVVDCLR